MPEWGLVLQFVAFLFVVAGAVVWLRATIRRTNHEELEKLASTRGERIDDLEQTVRRLEAELARTNARLDLMTSEFAREIAVQVIEHVKEIGS